LPILADKLILPPSVEEPLSRSWSESEAFAYCAKITHGHYENFPVGSVLIPASLRPAVHSLYAFMRLADDFSDENRRPGDEVERLAWLETWDQMLLSCQAGNPRHPVFIALRATLNKHQLPIEWLRDLLRAFKQDVTKRRYETYAEVLEYCRYSANPVGRLILALNGYHDEEQYRLSDSICTGLQLANHWQDVAIDLEKDRIYLPQEDLKRFGVSEEWLNGRGGGGGRGRDKHDHVLDHNLAFKNLMAHEVARAKALFAEGRALPERVTGRLKYELRMTLRGGMRVLDKIEGVQYDVFRNRPVVTRRDWATIAVQSILGQ